MTLRQEYIRWHVLRTFFQDRDLWLETCKDVNIHKTVSREAYERLLLGTDADVYVPLWASACLSDEDILLNDTTLQVIKFYKKYGYAAVDMDGNPPDYIGQQCRFMEYLFACRMKQEDEGLKRAGETFCNRFLLGCAHRIRQSVIEQQFGPEIEEIIELLEDAASGSQAEIPENSLSKQYDSLAWQQNEELPVEPARTVSHASFCDCGNKCKMLAVVQEGCVLSILPDKDFMGKAFEGCPRGSGYRQTFLSSRRLRYPMARSGERGEGRFHRISWEEAETRIAEAMQKTKSQEGVLSRFVLPAAGVCALMRGDRLMKHLLSCDGGYLDFYNFYSAACAEHILPYIYGTVFCGGPEEMLEESRLLLLWGHNPLDTHWGDGHKNALLRAKERGVKIIVIDPRCSNTACMIADQWIPIRPSTDGALADAMAYVIWSRGLQDQAFMDRYCVGFDEEHMPEGVPEGESYHSYLFGKKDGVEKTPEWAEAITGIPAQRIVDLAVELATAKPACVLPGLGPQRTLNGEQNCRSFAMLACLTGNVGVPGGSAGAITYLKDKRHFAPWFTPKNNPREEKIPSFLWTQAVEKPETIGSKDGLQGAACLESKIKTLFCLASGMLLNQHSNINQTIRILKNAELLEHVIVSDLFMTPSARFADILLPGVSFFETENIVGSWSSADYALFNQKSIKPVFGGRHEYDWIEGVAEKLGVKDAFSQGNRSFDAWLVREYENHRKMYEPGLPEYEVFKDTGGFVHPERSYHAAFHENIFEGVPFETPSGKIEVFSKALFEDGRLPGVPCYTPCEEGWEHAQGNRYPLQLIGFHSKRRCHSIGEGNGLLEELEASRLWIHPFDAEERGIRDGDLVEIFNERGNVCIPAWVTERIARGAVAMSEGGWYKADKKGRDRKGSINVLTMTHRNTPLAHGNPQHTNLVQVCLCRDYKK